MKVPVSESLAMEVATKVEMQVAQLSSLTPPEFIKRREGRGGKMLDYVTANYIVARLNSAFRFDWDFEIMEQIVSTKAKSIATRGRLTVRFADGHAVKKEQWGSADIKLKRGTVEALDISDDMKASASDALKKCASLLGIAWDVYGGYSKSGIPNGEPKTKAEQEQEDEAEDIKDAEVVEDHGFEDGFDDSEDPLDQAEFSDPEKKATNVADLPDPSVKKKDEQEPSKEDKYQTINIRWIDDRNYFVSKFEALDLFAKMKKALGDKFYYEILKQEGFEKSNLIPKEKIPTVMKLMVDAYLGK